MQARVLAIAGLLIVGGSACGGSSSKPTLKIASSPELKRSIVVDANGLTLYMFSQDAHGKATCVGDNPAPDCEKVWPPLVAEGKLKGGAGIDKSLLGTTRRADGKTQVTYNDHPLYYFAGYGDTPADKKPGDDNGQAFFSVWWVLSPKGTPIEQQ